MGDITIQTLPEVTFLHQATRCAPEEIAGTLGSLFGTVHKWAAERGIELLGPPTTLYTEMGSERITLAAGVAVPSGTNGDGEVLVTVLPAGRAAVTMHVGPYDRLGETHAAVEAFLKEEGLELDGAAREVYITDPGEVEDPEEWQTEVIWPVSG